MVQEILDGLRARASRIVAMFSSAGAGKGRLLRFQLCQCAQNCSFIFRLRNSGGPYIYSAFDSRWMGVYHTDVRV